MACGSCRIDGRVVGFRAIRYCEGKVNRDAGSEDEGRCARELVMVGRMDVDEDTGRVFRFDDRKEGNRRRMVLTRSLRF